MYILLNLQKNVKLYLSYDRITIPEIFFFKLNNIPNYKETCISTFNLLQLSLTTIIKQNMNEKNINFKINESLFIKMKE